jgi:Domain of unknown function (DUF222)/HNH endonuclease
LSELRSAIEALDVLVLPELPDTLIQECFAEVRRARERLEVIELRFLAESDRRQIHARDGHLSAASWLASVHRASWGSARAQVATARALKQMPVTLEALRNGEVSMSAAKLLVSARETHPEAFEISEPYLVEAARLHSITDLGRALAYWRQRADRERDVSTEESLRERRRLHASVTFEGMVRLDGDLDPETGELLLTALASVLDAESRGSNEQNTRTAPQRRCDALAEVLRQHLDRPDRATVAGERPHLTVTVDASVLAGDGAGLSELDHVGPISSETALRIACDASVMRVVMSADSQPLDVGRRTSIVPASMRQAVVVRDRHCRFPGCDRPQTWCDAHHIVHWARGGPTSVDNLLLLCRRHHTLIHGPSGFRLVMENGRPVFHRPDGGRPDGGRLELRGPPSTLNGPTLNDPA